MACPLRESPSLVKGVGLRTLYLRISWVQIPPPALQIGWKYFDISTCIEVLLQDDPESGQEIEENFCSALASIGDRV